MLIEFSLSSSLTVASFSVKNQDYVTGSSAEGVVYFGLTGGYLAASRKTTAPTVMTGEGTVTRRWGLVALLMLEFPIEYLYQVTDQH